MTRLRLSCFLVVLFSVIAYAQPPAHPDMVVSTAWLADHLKDPKVVVLHVVEKKSDYEMGHIPGARVLTFDDFMDVNVPMEYELPAADTLKARFENLGISNDSRVVIYTQDWFPWASRAWFTFEYLGLGDRAALLDGGMKQWELEKRPVTKDVPAAASKGSLTIHPNPELVAHFDDVAALSKAGGNDGKNFLVDARSEKRYEKGHLSGASNIFWEHTVVSADSPRLRSADELRKLWADQGFKPGEKSVSYCEVGIQASHDYFIAKYLGLDAALYDGSFHEWNMLKKQPDVKGSAKTGPLVESKGDMSN